LPYTSKELQSVRNNKIKTENNEKIQIEKLKKMISQSKTEGAKFLNINDTWSENEKKIFQNGLKPLIGKAKVMYFELMGLNRGYIEKMVLIYLILEGQKESIKML
jgi:hypothetical protein